LRIFARLNLVGRTVVLITHEPDVAAVAKRVVRLADGEVVDDTRASESNRLSPAMRELLALRSQPDRGGGDGFNG
jgi:putative ABC transport system ATP-binding protein